MRQDMQCFRFLIPYAAIQVIAVFGETGKVDNTEHGTMIGPGISIIRGRFTQIIEAGPYKLSDGPVMIVRQSEVLIGDVGP